MSTAASYDRRIVQAPKATASLAGVDLSSWLSWACYGLGFGLAIKLSPGMAEDLTSGGGGLTLMVSGIALFFALILIIQHQMSVSLRNTSFGEPQKLVTDGVFAVSRNPMYVAFLLPLASIAYYSPLSAVAAITLYIVAMNSLVIGVEEDILTSSFGTRFKSYCLSTPRWLVW